MSAVMSRDGVEKRTTRRIWPEEDLKLICRLIRIMDLRAVSHYLAITAGLVLLRVSWASAPAEQAAASPDGNFRLTESSGHSMNQCEQYFQDGRDMCATAKLCCLLGVDEYAWIAAAVGWSLWFLTLILICINKVANLRPDEAEKFTSP
uniref:transmembrane protein 213-like isoform X1 n=2 Tax=Pristiophorus japonicus TaxID=55135 RepID=UPI00398F17BF